MSFYRQAFPHSVAYFPEGFLALLCFPSKHSPCSSHQKSTSRVSWFFPRFLFFQLPHEASPQVGPELSWGRHSIRDLPAPNSTNSMNPAPRRGRLTTDTTACRGRPAFPGTDRSPSLDNPPDESLFVSGHSQLVDCDFPHPAHLLAGGFA